MVPTDQVQAQVDARGDASRCQDVAVVHPETIGLDVDRRVAITQLVHPLPVRRRWTPVEDACLGEREGTGTERDQARAARVRGLQRLDRPHGQRSRSVLVPGNDHRVGTVHRVQAVRSGDGHAARRQRSDRDGQEVVAGTTGEDLGCRPELERVEPGDCHEGDAMHGPMVANNDPRATSPRSAVCLPSTHD